MKGKLASWRSSSSLLSSADRSEQQQQQQQTPQLQTKKRFTPLGLGKSREAVVQSISNPSSPLRDAYASFSNFQQTPSSQSDLSPNNKHGAITPTYNDRTNRPKTAEALSNYGQTPYSINTTNEKPKIPSSSRAERLPPLFVGGSGSFSVESRPRNAANLEAQARRTVSANLRPPYSLVPPIATNFASHFTTTSPISRQSSRSATPRGTPTSTKLPAIRNSILDEVEGSLTATLRDFQSLQGSWHHQESHSPSEASDYPSLHRQPSQSSSWDTSQMGAPLAQHLQFTGPLSQPHTPSRHTPSSSGTFVNDQEYDAKVLAIQQAYDEQRKAAHVIQIESAHVRKQLEFLKERLVEFESEKHSLQQMVKDAEEKMQTTLAKLREAKVGELVAQKEFNAAKSTISHLEAKADGDQRKLRALYDDLEGERESVNKIQTKLEEANTHKVDLLERELDHRREIIVTKKKLKKAVDELNTIKRKLRGDTTSLTINPISPVAPQDVQLQLVESRRQNAVLQAKLQALEIPSSSLLSTSSPLLPVPQPALPISSSSSSSTSSSATTNEQQLKILRTRLLTSERARRDAIAERDHLSALLRAELRRVMVHERASVSLDDGIDGDLSKEDINYG